MNYLKILSYTLITIILIGCEPNSSFEELNRDPKNPLEVSSDALFTAALKSSFDVMLSTDVDLNVYNLYARYYSQTQYPQESNYNMRTRSIPSTFWRNIYQIIYNLELAKEQIANEEISEKDSKSKLAQIAIMKVYLWQVLVDNFGNIPYKDALNPETKLLPKYDDAKEIYSNLDTSLDEAISDIEKGKGFKASDLIYGGETSKWKKFANTLKLKLALKVAEYDDSKAKNMVESAYNSGVISSVDDNAEFNYLLSPPNTNPLWVTLVQSTRQDYVISDALANKLNALNDPRRGVFFDDNLTNYLGGVYGGTNTYANFTHIGSTFYKADLTGIIADYSEVLFYLSEAAQRGYSVGKTAEDYYKEAITASMNYWGIDDSMVTTYLSEGDVAYDSSSWRKKIGTQLWIAMFNRGFEGWTAYRKFDFEKFPVASSSKEHVPTRMTYPQTEQNLNNDNRAEAATAISGDKKSTKLFWDIN